jgi:hypothetical protein
MLSQNGNVPTSRWLRFDNSMASPDVYRNNPHEMGIHFDSDSLHSFNKASIDIANAVLKTYGVSGQKI